MGSAVTAGDFGRTRIRAAAGGGVLAICAVLLAGCQVPGSGSATDDTTTTEKAKDGPEWIVYVPPNPTPSAAPTAYQYPGPTPPAGLPPLPGGIPVPGVTLSYSPPCSGRLYRGKLDHPPAQAGAGSATTTWQSAGDPDVTGYRLTAISGDLVAGEQTALPWVDIAAPAGCSPVSGTMTGLSSGGWYRLWVTATVKTSYDRTPREVMIAESEAVKIP